MTTPPTPPGKPTSALGHALHAQYGDVYTTDDTTRYRWDGTDWQPLQLGDVCRNAKNGAAMVWDGVRFHAPNPTHSQIDELANVMAPKVFQPTPDQHPLDKIMDQNVVREAARRVLQHGYVHALNRPTIHPVAYHTRTLVLQEGDQVDVMWSTGRRTTHLVTHLTNGQPQLILGVLENPSDLTE